MGWFWEIQQRAAQSGRPRDRRPATNDQGRAAAREVQIPAQAGRFGAKRHHAHEEVLYGVVIGGNEGRIRDASGGARAAQQREIPGKNADVRHYRN